MTSEQWTLCFHYNNSFLCSVCIRLLNRNRIKYIISWRELTPLRDNDFSNTLAFWVEQEGCRPPCPLAELGERAQATSLGHCFLPWILFCKMKLIIQFSSLFLQSPLNCTTENLLKSKVLEIKTRLELQAQIHHPWKFAVGPQLQTLLLSISCAGWGY